ncbi:MAG: hypothetical protein V5A52_03955 [Halovenus sp.]|uniref:hypothetical protein n=1 Tax=Halovenus amylolytica TaxID=2500550 RepID=UPI002FC45E04
MVEAEDRSRSSSATPGERPASSESLRKRYAGQQEFIADLLVTVLVIVLWFGVALTLLILPAVQN